MNSLVRPDVAAVLKREHAAAMYQRSRSKEMAAPADATAVDFRSSERHRTHYLAIGPDQGRWLYGIARAISAECIVGFGTSFGISTLYLAAAVADTFFQF